jgi:putative transposase
VGAWSGRSQLLGGRVWNRWRSQYGGMKASEAKRLKELEAKNTRLKKLVANQALDIDMLKELAEGNF